MDINCGAIDISVVTRELQPAPVGEGQSLEWFWPPTAPVGYGGLPDWGDETMQRRPQLFGPRPTPWTRPTRITGAGTIWTLEYGEATAQKPAALRNYTD